MEGFGEAKVAGKREQMVENEEVKMMKEEMFICLSHPKIRKS